MENQIIGFAPCPITPDDTLVVRIVEGVWSLQAVNKADGSVVTALQQDNGAIEDKATDGN